MRRLVLLPLAMALIAAGSPTRAGDPEGALAKFLGPRRPGPARRCIFPDGGVQPEVFDRTAIVYRDGHTTYVNRLHGTCAELRETRRTVTVGTGRQLCENDPVHIAEATGPDLGFCTLGPFVPYDKPGR